MTIEEILAGESKNVEFKEALPVKSVKYIKSVVAFANGIGGKIIFGVSDEPVAVVGVDKDRVFKMMDAIANAISDSCAPAIVPDISLRTIDDKTIIVVEIAPGCQRPYYIKSQGRDEGTYIRVAGTTRVADDLMIRELMFEGSGRCYDQTVDLDRKVSKEEIDSLCATLKKTALENTLDETEKLSVKNVTVRQLVSWGVLVERNGEMLPTHAFSILSGDSNFVIQCGVFKGTTKAVFVDRRTFSGPIQDQIEQAYQFVLRNIRLGASFHGLYRQDEYELPTDAIRELIINAAVHRSYLDHGNIQVAIYDDRLEVTSPGKLPIGQTVARMMVGYSKVRNEALANAFVYMKLIEQWGSGIPRIIKKVEAAGLQAPTFEGGDTDLRICIYRHPIKNELTQSKRSKTSEVKRANQNERSKTSEAKRAKQNERSRKIKKTEVHERCIREYLMMHSTATCRELSDVIELSAPRTRFILASMDDVVAEGNTTSRVYRLAHARLRLGDTAPGDGVG